VVKAEIKALNRAGGGIRMPDYGCTRRQRKTRQGLKPEDADETPVERSEAQGAGAKRANAP